MTALVVILTAVSVPVSNYSVPQAASVGAVAADPRDHPTRHLLLLLCRCRPSLVAYVNLHHHLFRHSPPCYHSCRIGPRVGLAVAAALSGQEATTPETGDLFPCSMRVTRSRRESSLRCRGRRFRTLMLEPAGACRAGCSAWKRFALFLGRRWRRLGWRSRMCRRTWSILVGRKGM